MRLIDADALIMELDMTENLSAYDAVVFEEMIKEMPTANVPQWIPCSDGLPGSDGLPDLFEVLCCDRFGEIMIGHPFESEESETGYSAESEHEYMYDCVAWMPLPEPWKGE